MPQSSHPDDLQLPSARDGHHATRNRKAPSLPLKISPLAHTRTSTMDTTNARFAQRRSGGQQRAYGPVGHAGWYSTSAASRSGPPTKVLSPLDNKPPKARYLLRDNGGAQAATTPRMFCQGPSRVGVKKKRTPSLSQAFHPSHVARHASDRVPYPRSAPIHAQQRATLDLALLVL